jgi:FKBP-type peptidyl-prolyl cis-trans isomerase FkpA
MKKISVLFLLSVSLLMSCSKDDECQYSQSTAVAPESEVLAVEDYLATAGITGAIKHPSGMYYKIEAPGSGTNPGMCTQIGILYKGQLTNGTVFDETTGGQLRVFTLGTLIAGWKLGIPLIQTKGKIRLFVPPTLGYGATPIRDEQNNVIIPANSILIFDVELVAQG